MKKLACLILLALSSGAIAHHEIGFFEQNQTSVALLSVMFLLLVGSITITVVSHFVKDNQQMNT